MSPDRTPRYFAPQEELDRLERVSTAFRRLGERRFHLVEEFFNVRGVTREQIYRNGILQILAEMVPDDFPTIEDLIEEIKVME